MKKKMIIASVILGVIGVIAGGAARWLELENRGFIEKSDE